jgi:hypothetical protein
MAQLVMGCKIRFEFVPVEKNSLNFQIHVSETQKQLWASNNNSHSLKKGLDQLCINAWRKVYARDDSGIRS